MKRISLYTILIGLLALACGCSEERHDSSRTGEIILGVEKNEILYTKAGVPVTDEILSVEFRNEEGEIIKYFENYSESVEGLRIPLPAGVYDVVVSSENDKTPQWDTPFYYGEEQVTVVSGQTAKASIECRITNTKVSVEFSEAVDQYFSAYEAVVHGKSGSLTYGKEEKRSGFYFTDKLSVDLNLTNKVNGLKFQFNKLFPDIQPRYHYILKFDVQAPGGEENNAGGDIGIVINETDSAQVECTIFIPEYTQLAEQPKTPKAEVVTQVNNGEPTELRILEIRESNDIVNQHQLTIETQAGLRNLYFKLSDAFVADGLPPIFDLLKAEESLKEQLFITVEEEVIAADQQVYTLDLTKMVNQYMHAEESGDRNYALSVVILDNYHQEVELDFAYTIKPNLPLLAYTPTVKDKWATFAVLSGFCSPEGSEVLFRYGPAEESEDEWLTVEPQRDEEGNLNTRITGLEPATDYAFQTIAMIDGYLQKSNTATFTTDGTPVVPNLNFDDWEMSGKSWYLGGKGKYWDSGNDGANSLSAVNPTAPEYENIVGGSAAAKLESKYVVIAFAAGNIYTGSFGGVAGLGATLNFGQSYNGRPTKLTGYFMYQPKLINKVKPPYDALNGQRDMCSIYIALTDWEVPFAVNTNEGVFVDFASDNILAYGELDLSKCSPEEAMTAYEAFEIDIVYRDTTRTPKQVLIVASASRYGDYFTGGVGSTLYLDEFALHFDYNPASFPEAETIE